MSPEEGLRQRAFSDVKCLPQQIHAFTSIYRHTVVNLRRMTHTLRKSGGGGWTVGETNISTIRAVYVKFLNFSITKHRDTRRMLSAQPMYGPDDNIASSITRFVGLISKLDTTLCVVSSTHVRS